MAQEEQVPKLALYDQIKFKRTSHSMANIGKQEVLPSEEVLLCQWDRDQGDEGMPPSPGNVKVMASRMRHIWQTESWEGKVQQLGENWVSMVRKRNPGLSVH
jgi:hypothetical protein